MHWVDQDSGYAEFLSDLLKSSNIALSIADVQREDTPLVAVNDAFCNLSGYRAAEVLGRNCRFLQPAGGGGPVRSRMRSFLGNNSQNEAKFLVPNIRKDGTELLNLLYMGKLRLDGAVRLIIGSQFDLLGHPDATKEMYALALQEDLQRLSHLSRRAGWAMIGTYQVLAKSQAAIAQAKLDAAFK